MSEQPISPQTSARISAYVERISRRINEPKAVVADFREEMTTNLMSSLRELIREGYPEKQAIRQAIARFGDSQDVTKELKQHYRLKWRHSAAVLAVCFAALLASTVILGGLIGFWNERMVDKYTQEFHHIAEKEFTTPLNLSFSAELKRELAEWADRQWGVYGVAITNGPAFTKEPYNPILYVHGKDTETTRYLNDLLRESRLSSTPHRTFLVHMIVSSYYSGQETGKVDLSRANYTVHVAMRYFNYTFFYTLGIVLFLCYWLVFALWASAKAYADKRGSLYIILLFAALNVIGYSIYACILNRSYQRPYSS
ncbi:permease prefix domain 1-containing protein [Paenibacillus aurantiacus]|uniref:Permease prefix domain 1-containing protein n=1 Tax=Paenibacillus aurantiacus TaxID=1936118 RepID=A0ABV5KR26_9BACL